ncbi:TlpA family protein disulfide reductase [Demequina sp.]|uniref:TlpA family protein disulfide reductase n=1 Tax=Demequina sp. TaxID=2050685 RepID=UPI003D0FDB56
MRPIARWIIGIALLIAIALWLVGCTPGDAPDSPGYVSGNGTVTVFDDPKELALTGTSFAGEPVDSADFAGQVVLVNTWYAACPPCRSEAPLMVELDARDDVQVIGVNNRDDAPTAQAFERTFSVEYPSIFDEDGKAIAQLQGLVSINAVPTTLVVAPDGTIYARIIGEAEPSTLKSLVDDVAGDTAP